MLIENAFHYLPEILCGSNYAVQEYEAGIVNAISLAVLQELNGRNVANPLAALTVEKLYSKQGFTRPDDDPKRRYPRADLFVDTSRTFLGTEALSRFGWRHKNYLEAKFFRQGRAPSTTNATLLLADIVRLCVLTPPIVPGWKHKKNPKFSPCDGPPSDDGKYKGICVGRYLLHVYEGNPSDLVGKNRAWLKVLRDAGDGKALNVRIGDDKAKGFVATLSNHLANLELTAKITNRVIAQGAAKKKTSYLCVLTRIESFSVALNDVMWSEDEGREGTENVPGAWRTLQGIVGMHLLFKPKKKKKSEVHDIEDTPPSDAEEENAEAEGEETEGDVAAAE